MARQPASTPLMRQYLDIKNRYDDAILLFQLGDFYEMFYDDAVVAAKTLSLTLTSRDKQQKNPVPMCGVPQHAAKGYVKKLLDAGHKVAICDQVEDPKAAKGIVTREVTQVVTPGVVLESDHLEAKCNNYLVAITHDDDRFGVAALDLSTFELKVTEACQTGEVADELARLAPREVLAQPQTQAILTAEGAIDYLWHDLPETSDTEARQTVENATRETLLELGLAPYSAAICAAASALSYAAATLPRCELPTCRLVRYEVGDYLQLDHATLRNLEVFTSLREMNRSGTLLSLVDLTETAMGGRLLREWLRLPLREVTAIRRRHDAVEVLTDDTSIRKEIRNRLQHVYDLERLTTRVVLELATPREVARLGQSLAEIPQIGALLGELARGLITGQLPTLLCWPNENLSEIAKEIDAALSDSPPATCKEGGIFAKGFNPALDELIELCEGGRSDLLAIETRERERTGINSLKVRYNKVFGYYIEVTKANLENVPDDYQRKQTLANAERFVTAELAEYEAKILSAEERRLALELSLYAEFRAKIAQERDRLTKAAQRIATLDVLASLSEVADRYDYVRPRIDDSTRIEISDGRHPVVERSLKVGQFVPNDLTLDVERMRMLLITGPNMAGKSTVMRQVAHIVLLAQLGSFVPCRRARIGVVDRLFTRVGASDNLARGESTFMVEMRETAGILRHATARSLIVLDEIGRGTATYDGISIAWAVAEYLHDHVRARTLFATHYHELCQLVETRRHVENFNVTIKEWDQSIVFLYKLAKGGASRSYGIEVARLAGLPQTVVERAGSVLTALEGSAEVADLPLVGRTNDRCSSQLPILEQASDDQDQRRQLIERLARMNVEQITPVEALNALAALSHDAEKLTS